MKSSVSTGITLLIITFIVWAAIFIEQQFEVPFVFVVLLIVGVALIFIALINLFV